MLKRKICVFVGSRANYSSIKSALREINNHPRLELQLVLGASALLPRFGDLRGIIQRDGFVVSSCVNMLIEGDTPLTMAKSTGLGLIDFSTVFSMLSPHVVLVIGDRFEIMAAAIAAAYMNIPVAHTMGGEVSGTIDESIRHAVTKLAHLHFVSNADAAQRVSRLGESESTIFNVGCPRIDLVSETMNLSLSTLELQSLGVGAPLDIDKPFILVSQHPVTTEYGQAGQQMYETLNAVRNAGIQSLVLWPNADAGASDSSKVIRKFREDGLANNMRFIKNLSPETYIKLMVRTVCLVGNSSSGIREGAFIGTPVVNIGLRQNSRLQGANTINTQADSEQILEAIRLQIRHGRYASDHIYGDGSAGSRIADILASIKEIPIQKQIVY